jgi:hypothetical protein
LKASTAATDVATATHRRDVAATTLAAEVVFENAAHDYPKRVAYQRVDATHLTAWIDGGAGGGKRVTFAMQHEPCQP